MTRQARLEIRWMIRLDLAEVLAIEAASHRYPWSEADFTAILRRRSAIGMVALAIDAPGAPVVGFSVYEYQSHSIELLNLAVRPDWRRRGVGRRLLARPLAKLKPDGRARLKAIVPDDTPDAHYFFRACGLRAMPVVLRGHFGEDRDGYTFVHRIPAAVAAGT